jgi:hypothetical protein
MSYNVLNPHSLGRKIESYDHPVFAPANVKNDAFMNDISRSKCLFQVIERQKAIF